MISWRMAAAVAALGFLNFQGTTCRSPGQSEGGAAPSQTTKVVTLEGVDTSELTTREKHEWSSYVSELLAPCASQPVSLEQCVREKRSCTACVPAARYLMDQVRRGKARSQIEAGFRERFAPDRVSNIPILGSPAKGPANAPVVIVEWADFECPACQAAVSVLEELLRKHPDSVRLVFKNYPLSIHPNSEIAARAAVAADKQGAFWRMHPLLFEHGAPLDRAALEKIARSAGLDMRRFIKDLESEEVADLVTRDRKQGDAAHLTGTPTLYINGRKFYSSADFMEDLEDWVLLEIELKTGVRPAVAADSGRTDKPAVPKPEP
ncbi:MAG TPA: thioredoxin domain-containing protein [Polyangiaceae bacterium]|jgi:protein-disulfide isomerase